MVIRQVILLPAALLTCGSILYTCARDYRIGGESWNVDLFLMGAPSTDAGDSADAPSGFGIPPENRIPDKKKKGKSRSKAKDTESRQKEPEPQSMAEFDSPDEPSPDTRDQEVTVDKGNERRSDNKESEDNQPDKPAPHAVNGNQLDTPLAVKVKKVVNANPNFIGQSETPTEKSADPKTQENIRRFDIPKVTAPNSTGKDNVIYRPKPDRPPFQRTKDWFPIQTKVGKTIYLDTIPEWQKAASPHAKRGTPQAPYVAETLYHHGYFNLTSFIDYEEVGDGKPYFPNNQTDLDPRELIWPAQNNDKSVCAMRTSGKFMSHQIPHNLQQLLRCFSWWQRNPHQTPVLRAHRFTLSNYSRAYYDALKTVFGVQLKERPKPMKGEISPVMPSWKNFAEETESYAMDTDDALKLADGFLQHFFPDEPRAGCGSSERPKILFLNREKSRRMLENHQQVASALQEAGYENVRYQPNFSNNTMMEQILMMAQADIILGPHGAQFSSVLFQSPCGSLIEFFPEKYYVPNFFGSMAALSEKHHFFVYNGKYTGKAEPAQRDLPSYTVAPEVVVQLVRLAEQRLDECCKYGFRNGY